MTDLSVFRVYEPAECGPDGYPRAWHRIGAPCNCCAVGATHAPECDAVLGVKDLVRAEAGQRCARCNHPYPKGAGEWSPCDPTACAHGGAVRLLDRDGDWTTLDLGNTPLRDAYDPAAPRLVEAQWRILTVHHLRLGHDAKRDLRWWNLAALCQRCHLQIQGKVVMERVWPWQHTPWFRPYAAGWYAHAYLGEDLTREQVTERLDELLALEAATA